MKTGIPHIKLEDYFWAHPGMFIGKKSIYGLQCFLTGCWLSKSNAFVLNVPAFEEWVENKTKKKLNGRSFSVAQLLAGDDEKAFDLWASWYKEYKTK